MVDIANIEGAGGAGKGGGGATQGTEEPNSLRSTAIAKFVKILSEGPIVGLREGGKSVLLNKVPYTNPDNTENFKGVKWKENLGTPDQEWLEGFAGAKTEYEVGIRVRADTPCTYSTQSSDLDAVILTVMVPSITTLDKENGALKGASVTIAFDIRSLSNVSNTWVVDKIKDTIQGKQSGPYERSYRVQLPSDDPGPWLIKMRRLSPDNDDDSSIQNKTFFSHVTEVFEDRIAYADSAHVGIEFDASQFSGNAEAQFDIRGKLINYPSNYNPTTGLFTGIWNGTWSFGFCRCPAWVFMDLCVNPRYGLGLPVSYIDKWALYSLSKYCNQLVPDGFGGTERRFEFNGSLSRPDDAFKVLQQIASLMRAIVFYGAGSILVRHDAPKEVTRTYSPANIIGNFQYASTAKSARHNACLVKWRNPELGYEDDYAIYEDRAAIIKYGRNLARIEGFATKSHGQAHRQAKWLVLTEQLQSETVVFEAGLDGADVLPGDLIQVADPHWATADFAGRVKQATNAPNLVPPTALLSLTSNSTTISPTVIEADDVSIPPLTLLTAQAGTSTNLRAAGWSFTPLVNGNSYRVSCFVRKGSVPFVALSMSGLGRAAFNLDTMEVSLKTGDVVAAGIEQHSEGVCRIWMRANCTVTTNAIPFACVWNGKQLPFSPANNILNQAFVGGEAVYVGGMMVELAADALHTPSKFNVGVLPGNKVALDRSITHIGGGQLGLTLLDGPFDDVPMVADPEDRPARRKVQYHSSSVTSYDAFNRIATIATTLSSDQNDKFTPIVWVYSSSALAPRPFVVVDNDPQDNETSFQITALEYSVEKFVKLDEGFNITFPQGPYTDLPSTAVCPPPRNLAVTVITQTLQGLPASGLNISWQPPLNYPYISQYLVRVRQEDGNWLDMQPTANTTAQLDNLPPGAYLTEVRAVNLFNRVSLPVSLGVNLGESIDPTKPRVISLVSDLGNQEFADKDLRLYWLSTAPGQDPTNLSIRGTFTRSAANVSVDGEGTQVQGAGSTGTGVSVLVTTSDIIHPTLTLSGTIAKDDSVTITVGPTQFTYTATSSDLTTFTEGLKTLIDADPRYTATRTGLVITLSFVDEETNATNIAAHNDPTFLRYKVEIRDAITNALKSSAYTAVPNYTYSYAQHIQDFGAATRDVKVCVLVESISGDVTAPTIEIFHNDAPTLLVAQESIISNSVLLTFSEASNDPDFAGYVVWASEIDGFPTDDAHIVWKGRGFPLFAVNADSTTYYRYALFDAFGTTGLAISTQKTVTVAGGSSSSSSQILIYKRSVATPTLPSATTTYTYATGNITGLNNGWTKNIPAGTDPLWVSLATAYSSGLTDTINPGEWAAPVIMAGSSLNTATVFLFYRTTTDVAPAAPDNDITYNFTTGLLTGSLDGWAQGMPTTGGPFRWMITASALSAGTSTDTIDADDWSEPSLLAEDGKDAIDIKLSRPLIHVPVNAANEVTTYANVTSTFIIKSADGVDISSHFTLSTASGGNPAGLTVAYTGMDIAITNGYDEQDDVTLTVKATGSGLTYGDYVYERTLTLTKSGQRLFLTFVAGANNRNALVPDPVTITSNPFLSSLSVTGQVSIGLTYTSTYSADPANKNNFSAMEYGIYTSNNSTPYTFGTDPAKEKWSIVQYSLSVSPFSPNIVTGGDPDVYYTLGVRKVRSVHSDVPGSVNGILRSAVAQTTTPFRPSNASGFSPVKHRMSLAASDIPAVTFQTNGLALEHNIRALGVADIRLVYAYSGGSSLIDGFEILAYANVNSAPYTIGTFPLLESKLEVGPNVLGTILRGVSAELFYTFYVRAFRNVDSDIDVTGRVYGPWAKPTLGSENPYQPATQASIDSAVVINGRFAGDVATWSGYASLAVNSDGTIKPTRVITSSVANQALIAAGYNVLSGTYAFSLNETWSGLFNISSLTLLGSRAVMDMQFNGVIAMNNPTINTTYGFAIRGFIERVSNGARIYSDPYQESYQWLYASASGSYNSPRQTRSLQFVFTGFVTNTAYNYGFEINCDTNSAAILYPYRYGKLNDLRAVE